jgi:hypothetical protein
MSVSSAPKWPAAELDQLRSALLYFVSASGRALKVAVKMAAEAPEQKEFIAVLEQGFAALERSVRLIVPAL